MQEIWVQSLGQEDPLEKEMATCSSIFAWKTAGTEEPGWPATMGSQRVRHDWVNTQAHTHWGSYVKKTWRESTNRKTCKEAVTVMQMKGNVVWNRKAEAEFMRNGLFLNLFWRRNWPHTCWWARDKVRGEKWEILQGFEWYHLPSKSGC